MQLWSRKINLLWYFTVPHRILTFPISKYSPVLMTRQTCTVNRRHIFWGRITLFFPPFSSLSPLTPCVLYSNERSEVRTLFSSRPWMLNNISTNSSMTSVCSEATEKWKQMLIWGLTQTPFADLYLWSALGPLTKSDWAVISDLAPFSDGFASFSRSLVLLLASQYRGSPLILLWCPVPLTCNIHKARAIASTHQWQCSNL